MIVVGLTCNPLQFCQAMKKSNQAYSIDKINHAKNIVCTSFSEFKRIRPLNTNKRVIIFDALEKLKTITNIVLVKGKNVEDCVKKTIKETNHTKISIKNHDYIRETLDKNNDESISFLHDYNTNLYNITSVVTRESIRTLYFDLLHSRISREKFDKEINPLYPKRGKSSLALDNLLALLDCDLFKQTQKAIVASKGKHDRDLEKIAKDHGIAPFDLNYWLKSRK